MQTDNDAIKKIVEMAFHDLEKRSPQTIINKLIRRNFTKEKRKQIATTLSNLFNQFWQDWNEGSLNVTNSAEKFRNYLEDIAVCSEENFSAGEQATITVIGRYLHRLRYKVPEVVPDFKRRSIEIASSNKKNLFWLAQGYNAEYPMIGNWLEMEKNCLHIEDLNLLKLTGENLTLLLEALAQALMCTRQISWSAALNLADSIIYHEKIISDTEQTALIMNFLSNSHPQTPKEYGDVYKTIYMAKVNSKKLHTQAKQNLNQFITSNQFREIQRQKNKTEKTTLRITQECNKVKNASRATKNLVRSKHRNEGVKPHSLKTKFKRLSCLSLELNKQYEILLKQVKEAENLYREQSQILSETLSKIIHLSVEECSTNYKEVDIPAIEQAVRETLRMAHRYDNNGSLLIQDGKKVRARAI